ncbi:hypothetical protein FYJ26_10615 [Anaerococcus sp. WCA-380-WT-2B]|uniref:Uncharacterized protein n=1 Tax=Anaerococcus porci TaxID=2652269 RepID=A0A6N7VXT6_9FIRM|nr:hypothetical protein [Anaerococcus porci]MSS78823.1 hypothetical protein [Anaerococcus porci]
MMNDDDLQNMLLNLDIFKAKYEKFIEYCTEDISFKDFLELYKILELQKANEKLEDISNTIDYHFS